VPQYRNNGILALLALLVAACDGTNAPVEAPAVAAEPASLQSSSEAVYRSPTSEEKKTVSCRNLLEDIAALQCTIELSNFMSGTHRDNPWLATAEQSLRAALQTSEARACRSAIAYREPAVFSARNDVLHKSNVVEQMAVARLHNNRTPLPRLDIERGCRLYTLSQVERACGGRPECEKIATIRSAASINNINNDAVSSVETDDDPAEQARRMREAEAALDAAISAIENAGR
jgi:hypothetical protein